MRLLVALLVVFGQVQPQNAWDGTWTWGAYEERIKYGEAQIAQTAAIAHEHCGEQYFGTICQ